MTRGKTAGNPEKNYFSPWRADARRLTYLRNRVSQIARLPLSGENIAIPLSLHEMMERFPHAGMSNREAFGPIVLEFAAEKLLTPEQLKKTPLEAMRTVIVSRQFNLNYLTVESKRTL